MGSVRRTAEDLYGTAALVIGASSGIGQATATALAARVASVALATAPHRTPRRARRTGSGGWPADLTITADVTDEAQAGQAEKTVLARNGSGVNNATKHAFGAFSESLPQEVTRRHLRVSLVEPDAFDNELTSHNRPVVQVSLNERFGAMERSEPENIAEAIEFIVTRPRRVAVNEVLVRPTEQEG